MSQNISISVYFIVHYIFKKKNIFKIKKLSFQNISLKLFVLYLQLPYIGTVCYFTPKLISSFPPYFSFFFLPSFSFPPFLPFLSLFFPFPFFHFPSLPFPSLSCSFLHNSVPFKLFSFLSTFSFFLLPFPFTFLLILPFPIFTLHVLFFLPNHFL